MKTVTISNTTKSSYPIWPYQDIKNAILGYQYELSLSFIGTDRAKRLNLEYRNKDYVPNVLSFPLSEKIGDIFICPKVAAKEARDFNMSERGYVAFLFIHGCLHLKGHDHGVSMEKLEKKYLTKYKIK